MSKFFGIFDNDDERIEKEDERIAKEKEDDSLKNVDDEKLRLRQEELDISKNRVQVGEVELSKEIIEEQKIVDVPVTHEEVVIERRAINNEASDSPITDEEAIHIPISEEQVQVGKHTVVTGEIEVHKREVEDTKHIEETLKREEAHVNKEGNARIIDEEEDGEFH
ncbi:YsnF/AvaK domain-containing protein [Clostridium formicaceticum]|uniref:Stress response protein YsnF n=1 Tax=Clostridium formicaceticum TaxID=1497 RepID=A0AAC9RMW2_9CLOT|nr:YsnF/AvaK domain-containing protein [Clostridium formicaceticum]ARE88532.1 Stress response protein YsnF [Clostridium formicaceticum]